MTAATLSIPVMALPARDRSARPWAVVASCAMVDAFAAGILLLGAPRSPLLAVLAAIAHGTAVLLLARLAGTHASRRWLSIVAMAAIPGIGAAIAGAILLTRGRDVAATVRRVKPRRRPSTSAVSRRFGQALPLCDALGCGDDEDRHDAMSALSRRGDPEAIAVLRWVAAGHDADLALSAALALDEIGERAERGPRLRDSVEARRVG